MQRGLWPFRPAPFGDELLTSWIARLALGHGLRPGSFLNLIHPASPDFATLDWVVLSELVSVLADGTGVTPSAIESLRLRFDPERGLLDVLHHNWQGPALQFCGECLTNGVSYYRRHWRLACVRLCPAHRAVLGDCCAHCGSMVRVDVLEPSKLGLGACHNCGEVLGGARPEAEASANSAVIDDLIAIQTRIALRLI